MRYLNVFPILAAFAPPVAANEPCKCGPSDPCWPAESKWKALNDTVSGRLIKAVPPAAVCYQSHPKYNVSACEKVFKEWFTSSFHAADPISLGAPDWSGNSCPPIYSNGTSILGNPTSGEKGCTIGKHSAYVVNATGASDVRATIQFAKEHNIALVIKNTGHSYTGRNTGYGSLSIWTHWLKKITYHEKFEAYKCPSTPQKAATLGAGVQVYEMYEEMEKHGAVMVGGANPTVGVVGWFTGGGHGPLSSNYGMGADNLIEATVVIPSGEVVTTNACQHPDLFWALRGGGGSTFGVILDATMKAYSTPQTTLHSLFVSTKHTKATKEFYNTTAYILSQYPRLKEAGMQGYFGFRAGDYSGTRYLSLYQSFYLYNQPNGTAESLIKPIRQYVEQQNLSLSYSSQISSAPSFFQQFKKAAGAEPVALGGGAMGGWLLPRSALSNVTRLARALEIAGPSIDGPISMHITGHFSAPNAGKDIDNSMNPAWRDAVVDLIPFEPVVENAPTDVVEANANRMTFTKQQALRELAPESGAYFNECDVREPDWQGALFGRNYGRLLSVKQKYDPDGLQWCRNCVGSEIWTEQRSGGLCRASPSNLSN